MEIMQDVYVENKIIGQKSSQKTAGTQSVNLDSKDLLVIAKALSSSTRITILKLLNEEEMDVSKIASRLEQTEANISAQIAILQKAKLVTCAYQPGGHGVRKVCRLNANELLIQLF